MRFSVWPTNQQRFESVLAVCRHAEETGWDGVWTADHFMPGREPLDVPVVEGGATTAAIAALVPRVRIGTLVLGNTYRHPAVTAKMAATIDEISGGRLVLGIGAGWQENEHRAYGIPYPTARERLERLDEACTIIRSLLTQPRTTFAGRYYQVDDAVVEPRPQAPLPILVGAKGERRALAVVARHADEWNVWATPELFRHKSSVLDEHCEREGREPSTIRRSAQALVLLAGDGEEAERMRAAEYPMPAIVGTTPELSEIMGAYAAAGVDEFIVPAFGSSLDRTRSMLDTFIGRVAEPYRVC